jgi:hypothetical protein
MAQRPSRFNLHIWGATRAAQVVPVHSAHTASMMAQASRVPRLAGLVTNVKLTAAARSKSKR